MELITRFESLELEGLPTKGWVHETATLLNCTSQDLLTKPVPVTFSEATLDFHAEVKPRGLTIDRLSTLSGISVPKLYRAINLNNR